MRPLDKYLPMDQLSPEAQEERRRYEEARAYEAGARKANADRSSRPETMSRYDMVADALMTAVGDAVFAAINSPDFAHELRERHGLVIGPAADEAPAAPFEWAERVMDFANVDGRPTDPLELIDELWSEAWRAGYEARAAQSGGEES